MRMNSFTRKQLLRAIEKAKPSPARKYYVLNKKGEEVPTKNVFYTLNGQKCRICHQPLWLNPATVQAFEAYNTLKHHGIEVLYHHE